MCTNHWLRALERMEAYLARTHRPKQTGNAHKHQNEGGEGDEGMPSAHVCERTGKISYITDRRK